METVMMDGAKLQLFIEGKDMTDEVGIISAIHDTYAGDYVDTVVCSLQDKDGTWSKWRPKAGEKLEVKLKTARTGTMWIHKVTSTNGIYTVTARAIPPYKNGVQKREWESISFLQICQTIASDLGLSFDNQGASDQTYKRMYQMDESNTAFIRRLCHQEGLEMLCFDGKLVVYDEATLEHQAPALSIDFTGEGDFSFSRNEGDRVGSIRVVRIRETNDCGRLDQGDKFDLKEETLAEGSVSSGEGRTLTFSNLRPNDDGEASRWAAGLLKHANKYNSTGRFKRSLELGLAAGSVIQIKNDRASEWNGPVFLYRVRHDYGAQVSTLYFRGIGG